MKRFILNTLLATVLVLSLAACNKYEDGPGISFRSRRDRVEGDWRVGNYTYNGSDITSEYANDRYNFAKNGDLTYTYTDNGLSVSTSGSWALVSDDEKLRTTTTLFGITTTDEWDILELRDKTMKLRKTEDGNTEVATLEQ
jgi:Lipocalin-like domain